ncbi:MAG: 30S ribosomal protein S8, partial [Gemmatimonadaceae bacterium]
KWVDVPHSKLKVGLADVLKREGFIDDYTVEAGLGQGVLKIKLRYGPDGEHVIRQIRRESKPGCRVYKGVAEAARVLGGIGISVYSTTKGILSDRECREKNVGGEFLCTVW